MGRLISCKDASRLISQLQDSAISPWQWVRIRVHLLWCDACASFEKQLRLLRAAMRQYRQE